MARKAVRVVRTVKELRRAVARWRGAGERIALVPTMGALHDGHLALVRLARRKAKRVVVSIFVNPTQFAPTEDLSRYPRDEAGDLAKLAIVGADLVWAPSVAEMYPEGAATSVVPQGAALGLEGEFRPHHFGGVATVCCKLFNQVTPDVAVFGEKDYQQLCVIRQMVRDLDMPLTIAGLPTVREKDGLALSSRNAYLSPDERSIAPALNKALREVARAVSDPPGQSPARIAAACDQAKSSLLAAGFAKVDYVEVRDAESLASVKMSVVKAGSKVSDPEGQTPVRLRVLAVAWLGRTRLIDNVGV